MCAWVVRPMRKSRRDHTSEAGFSALRVDRPQPGAGNSGTPGPENNEQAGEAMTHARRGARRRASPDSPALGAGLRSDGIHGRPRRRPPQEAEIVHASRIAPATRVVAAAFAAAL